MLALRNIDWAVAYHLEKAATLAGYYPDKDAFLPANQAGFDAALSAIIAAKGYYIDIMAFGNYDARADLSVVELVVQRVGISPSKTNYARGNVIFEPKEVEGEPFFDKKVLPETLYDIDYEIRAVSDNISAERAVTEIMLSFLGMGGYKKGVEVSGNTRSLMENEQLIFIKQAGNAVDLSGAGYMERLWKVQALHVGITPLQSVQTVPAIKEITIETIGKKGNETNFTDSITI